MRITALVDAIRTAPFKPFEIHSDGRVVAVDHPEQIYLTPDRQTTVVAHPDGHLYILDVDRISSLTLKPRRSRKSTSE